MRLVATVSRDQLLTSAEVVLYSGLISYRQLDHWATTGLIEPTIPAEGSGTQRLWDPSVLEEIADLVTRIDACPFEHGLRTKDSPRAVLSAARKSPRRRGGPRGMLRRIP